MGESIFENFLFFLEGVVRERAESKSVGCSRFVFFEQFISQFVGRDSICIVRGLGKILMPYSHINLN